MLSKSALLFTLVSASVWAQEFRATLTGRVIDAQNAAVPSARITATLISTGAKSETSTGADGLYTIPFLPPGDYRITAEASGFKRYVRDKFQVSTGERIGLDIPLELGQVSETVNVSADAPLLETTTATMGQVITSSQVENMPMNGRTPLVLAQLAIGVVPNSDPKFNRPFDNSGPSGFSMGGAPAQTNELLVDGAPDTTGNLRVAYNPPVDAVDEVRVHSFESDAAYGHTGGGTANVVLKSGTNDLHGTASEFNQTSALAATPFFTNAAGLEKPVTRYNQWGTTTGGPLYIPKVYDGRNKVFWYFGWEFINDSFPEPLTTTVPTTAERNGDLSALLKIGNNYQLYDPFSGAAQGSRIARQPIPGNVIPANRISAIAKNYLQFYPLPNQPGDPDGQNNFLANSVRRDTYNSELGRLDFNLSMRNKLFWSFRHNDRIEDRGNRFKNIATGRDLGRINWGTTLDDVYTFSPTTVMNVRLNWTRFKEYTISFGDGFNGTQLGLPAYITAAAPRLVLPRLTFNRGFNQITSDTDSFTPFDIFQIFADVVKVSGKHSIKMGIDARELRESSVGYGNSQGSYSFDTNWTRGPNDNSTSAPLGQDWAAFMMGLPSGGSFDINAFRTNQAKYFALFLQDDWRVKSNLSLNLGLRFEHEFPTTERFNRSINGFDTTATSPIAAQAIAAYAKSPIPQIPAGQFKVPGGLTYAGAGDPAIYHTESFVVSPRLGVAWTPAGANGKTVIRGGAGVFMFPIGTAGVQQPGYSQSTPVVATLNSYLTPHATLANPFPDGFQLPTGSSLGLATFLGRGITFFNPHVRNAYSFRWEFGIQRQLGGGIVLETAYVGNHAVHLPMGSTPANSGNRQLNFVPRQYYSTSPIRDQAAINLFSDLVASPFVNLVPGTSLNGSTVSRSTLLLPFPEFGGIAQQVDNGASSYFGSLDVRLQKRFSHGLLFVANYTWSKLIEKIRLLNDFDEAPEKRVSGDDRPQRFVASASYELPIGAGKLLDFGHRWTNRLLGGWIVNGIYSWQVGSPLGAWGNVIYFGGDINLNPRKVSGTAFDTTHFDTKSTQQLGDNVRAFPTQFGSLRQDGANNFDLSMIKNTHLTEKINFQLRFESFNALNHPEFDAPSLSVTSSGFAKITGQPNLSRSIQLGARVVW